MERNNNGQFTKGNKGGGRPKGSTNKNTTELRERISLLLDENWDDIQNDLKSLTPKERIDAYIKLLEYSLPKLNRTQLTAEVGQAESFNIRDLVRFSD